MNISFAKRFLGGRLSWSAYQAAHRRPRARGRVAPIETAAFSQREGGVLPVPASGLSARIELRGRYRRAQRGRSTRCQRRRTRASALHSTTARAARMPALPAKCWGNSRRTTQTRRPPRAGNTPGARHRARAQHANAAWLAPDVFHRFDARRTRMIGAAY